MKFGRAFCVKGKLLSLVFFVLGLFVFKMYEYIFQELFPLEGPE